VRLVRDLGRVLNGVSQFVGRPEGEPQWHADVCQVRKSRKSGFSACQVLSKTAGRSASRATVCRAFVREPKRFLPGHRNTGGGKVCEKVVDEVPQKRRLANTEVAGPSKMQVLLMRMYLHHHAWRALS
jgi:hypothetical protein